MQTTKKTSYNTTIYTDHIVPYTFPGCVLQP